MKVICYKLHIAFAIAGVGIASLIMLIWRNAYYIIVSVWSGYYAFHIFSGIWGDLPWRSCGHQWNSAYCRESEYGCIPLNETLKFLNKTSIYNITANDAAFLKRYNVTACELVKYPAEDFFRSVYLSNDKQLGLIFAQLGYFQTENLTYERKY